MIREEDLEQAKIDEWNRQRQLEVVIQKAIDDLRRSCRELEGHIKAVFAKARKDYDPDDWEFSPSMSAEIHNLCEQHHLKVSAQLGDLQSLFARSYKGLYYESQTPVRVSQGTSFREIVQTWPISSKVPNLLD